MSLKFKNRRLPASRCLLRELDERNKAQFLHESADAMFSDLDKKEVEYARRNTR
jgi:hypothetical protein